MLSRSRRSYLVVLTVVRPTRPFCRNGGFPFLTGGETLLVLRDLARRKVLLEHTVPDTAVVSRCAVVIGALVGGAAFLFKTTAVLHPVFLSMVVLVFSMSC